MHIECGTTNKAPSITARRLIVSLALRELEGRRDASHTVMILCGDCNLKEEEAKQAAQDLQPEVREATLLNTWIVHKALGCRGGDVLFCKGAIGSDIYLSEGKSYSDRGMRGDDHDAFGVELALPMTPSQDPRASVCVRMRVHAIEPVGASQPDRLDGKMPTVPMESDHASRLGLPNQVFAHLCTRLMFLSLTRQILVHDPLVHEPTCLRHWSLHRATRMMLLKLH